MTSSRARQIVLAARPKGKPELTDFRLEETAIPTLGAGQLLLGVQYLSLDPYMRGRMNDGKSYATPLEIGEAARRDRGRRRGQRSGRVARRTARSTRRASEPTST